MQSHLEDDECKALWQWAQYIPIVRDMLYHIPNGGKRDAREAARFKGMGVRAGVSDYHLPIARGQFIGLYLEMKAGVNTETDAQMKWGARVERHGHVYLCCQGWSGGRRAIEWYMALPEPEIRTRQAIYVPKE